MRTVTSLAANTSSAVIRAGSDRAWVSAPRKSGPSVPWRGPVLADGLAGGGDVVLVERRGEGRAAVPRGAERHPLARLGRVGVQRVVRRDQPGHIDEVLGPGDLSRSRVLHFPAPPQGRPLGTASFSPARPAGTHAHRAAVVTRRPAGVTTGRSASRGGERARELGGVAPDAIPGATGARHAGHSCVPWASRGGRAAVEDRAGRPDSPREADAPLLRLPPVGPHETWSARHSPSPAESHHNRPQLMGWIYLRMDRS